MVTPERSQGKSYTHINLPRYSSRIESRVSSREGAQRTHFVMRRVLGLRRLSVARSQRRMSLSSESGGILSGVPVIDLSELQGMEVPHREMACVEHIREACSDWGFFQVPHTCRLLESSQIRTVAASISRLRRDAASSRASRMDTSQCCMLPPTPFSPPVDRGGCESRRRRGVNGPLPQCPGLEDLLSLSTLGTCKTLLSSIPATDGLLMWLSCRAG